MSRKYMQWRLGVRVSFNMSVVFEMEVEMEIEVKLKMEVEMDAPILQPN